MGSLDGVNVGTSVGVVEGKEWVGMVVGVFEGEESEGE